MAIGQWRQWFIDRLTISHRSVASPYQICGNFIYKYTCAASIYTVYNFLYSLIVPRENEYFLMYRLRGHSVYASTVVHTCAHASAYTRMQAERLVTLLD